MEDNKIDINSLIGFFLIGLIFIGWLYLNPPPPSSEVVQTLDNDESIVEEPAEQDLSDILSESKIDEYNDDEGILNFENLLTQNDEIISVDADKFIVVDRDGGTAFFFKDRPSYDNPSDANGDNIYEFELTKSDGSNSVTKTVRIEVREPQDGASDPLTAPATPLVLNVDEVPEEIGGDRGGSRNLIGTDEADTFVRDNNGFKYISGGAGDDIFKELREGYLTGGEGSDTYFLSADARGDKDNFGIRDNSKPYV